MSANGEPGREPLVVVKHMSELGPCVLVCVLGGPCQARGDVVQEMSCMGMDICSKGLNIEAFVLQGVHKLPGKRCTNTECVFTKKTVKS